MLEQDRGDDSRILDSLKVQVMSHGGLIYTTLEFDFDKNTIVEREDAGGNTVVDCMMCV